MKKVIIQQANNNYPTREIRADRPMAQKPIILREYWRSGVRYYKTVCGKTFIADTYDKMFIPAVQLQVKPEHYKGESPDQVNAWKK